MLPWAVLPLQEPLVGQVPLERQVQLIVAWRRVGVHWQVYSWGHLQANWRGPCLTFSSSRPAGRLLRLAQRRLYPPHLHRDCHQWVLQGLQVCFATHRWDSNPCSFVFRPHLVQQNVIGFCC